jgi:hypothetical protein
MTITVTCMNGHKLKAKEALVGKKVPCPKCGAVVLIEAPAEEMLVDLGTFAVEEDTKPSGDQDDPFGNLGVDTESQTPSHADFGTLSGLPQGDPFAGVDFGNLSSGFQPTNQSSGMQQSGVRTQPSNSPSVDDNPKSKWLAAAILGSVGVLSGLAIGIPVLTWMLSGDHGNNTAQSSVSKSKPLPQLVESKVLLEEFMNGARRFKAAEFGYSDFNNIPKDKQAAFEEAVASQRVKLEQELKRLREVFPEFLFLTPDEDKRLAGGEEIEITKKRWEILNNAESAIFDGERSEVEHQSQATPAMLELLSQRSILIFREKFKNLKSIDQIKWNRLKEIEASWPNASSMFERLDQPVDEKKLDLVALDKSLRMVGIGILNYESQYGAIPSPDGFPLVKTGGLSWRVAILGTLGYPELYKEFRLDEPWDSEHNKMLLAKMPSEFKTPQATKEGFTTIISTMGVESVMRKGQPRSARTLEPNPSRHAMVVAGGTDTAIPWTCPDEKSFDSGFGIKDFGADSPLIVLFADGSRRKLPATLSDEQVQSLVFIQRKLGLPETFESMCPLLEHEYNARDEMIYHLRRLEPR